MDEPLSNLDAKLRIEARSFLAKMHQELGTTTVYVTHDQSEAMTMGDTDRGHERGPHPAGSAAARSLQRPANMFVAGFIGSPGDEFPRSVAAPVRRCRSAARG